MTSTTRLDHAVFVSDSTPQRTPTPPHSQEQAVTAPLTPTLILGEHDAVLVDAPATLTQAAPPADWAVASGERLPPNRGAAWLNAGALHQSAAPVSTRDRPDDGTVLTQPSSLTLLAARPGRAVGAHHVTTKKELSTL